MKYLLIVLMFSCFTGSVCAQSVAVKKQAPKTEMSESEIIIVDLVGQGKEFDGNLYLVEEKYYIAESMMQVLDKLKIVMDKDIESMRVSTVKDLKKENQALINKIPAKYHAKLKGIATIALKPKAE